MEEVRNPYAVPQAQLEPPFQSREWVKACDGSRAGLARLFWLRSFVPALIGAIPRLGVIFHLADAVAIFDDEKRCVHDFIADTSVVNA